MGEKKLLKVLSGEAVWPPPVWLMRQAGRYLPEFRALRGQADFITRCTTPDLATEITLQPLRRYGMDGAILFSDILMLPWAMGQGLEFREGTGPVMDPIRSEADLDRLSIERSVEAVAPILETVSRVRRALGTDFPDTALIGFAGSPFTVACYMVDGGGSKDFVETRTLSYRQPALFDRLIRTLVEATILYLSAQIDAGAEAVMLFDSWAGVLPPSEFARLVIAPTRTIVERLNELHPDIPVIGFPRLAGLLIDVYAERTGVDCVALDTVTEPSRASELISPHVALQGNLDPLCLLAGGPRLSSEVRTVRDALRGRPHIFNLGHGVLPSTPPEHVGQLVEAVRQP